MYKNRLLSLALMLSSVLLLPACSQDMDDEALIRFDAAVANPSVLGVNYERDQTSNAVHRVLPTLAELDLNEAKVALGNKLFHDNRLSTDNSMSCAFCHDTMKGGDDGLKTAIGVRGQIGPINSPTVLNSGFNFRQFWDGRSHDLQDQAHGPVNNPGEMGSNWPEVLEKIKSDPYYIQAFLDVYSAEMDDNLITDAIAEYETALITPAPFDKYLAGDKSAISAQAVKGYALFNAYGCVACHQGVNYGGNMYQKFGALQAYFAEKTADGVDLGRFNDTNNANDKFVFKVPSLRNIELTGPYFHNAIVSDLSKAVKIMAINQLGRTLTDEETADIVSFLKTLTGELLVKPAK